MQLACRYGDSGEDEAPAREESTPKEPANRRPSYIPNDGPQCSARVHPEPNGVSSTKAPSADSPPPPLCTLDKSGSRKWRSSPKRSSKRQNSNAPNGLRNSRRASAALSAPVISVSKRILSENQRADEEWGESMMPGSGRATGAENELQDASYLTEMYTEEELSRVILPFSRLRVFWDLLTLALVFYTALTLPYFLCFMDSDEDPPDSMQWFDFCMDFIFLFDIGINFFTAYVAEDAQLVISRDKIARNYITGWLPIDASGSIPWEVIFMIAKQANGGDSDSGGLQGLQIIKILKVPKLLRIGRLFKFLARFEGAANIWRIFVLVAMLMVLIHWLASIFYVITKNSDGCNRHFAAEPSRGRVTDVTDVTSVTGVANVPTATRASRRRA